MKGLAQPSFISPSYFKCYHNASRKDLIAQLQPKAQNLLLLFVCFFVYACLSVSSLLFFLRQQLARVFFFYGSFGIAKAVIVSISLGDIDFIAHFCFANEQ